MEENNTKQILIKNLLSENSVGTILKLENKEIIGNTDPETISKETKVTKPIVSYLFRSCKLNGVFANILFTECHFIGCEILNCKFIDCTFQNCVFSGSDLVDGLLENCQILNCSLMNVLFCREKIRDTNISKNKAINCVITESIFKLCNILRNYYLGTKFYKCELSNCDIISNKFVRFSMEYSPHLFSTLYKNKYEESILKNNTFQNCDTYLNNRRLKSENAVGERYEYLYTKFYNELDNTHIVMKINTTISRETPILEKYDDSEGFIIFGNIYIEDLFILEEDLEIVQIHSNQKTFKKRMSIEIYPNLSEKLIFFKSLKECINFDKSDQVTPTCESIIYEE